MRFCAVRQGESGILPGDFCQGFVKSQGIRDLPGGRVALVHAADQLPGAVGIKPAASVKKEACQMNALLVGGG